MAMILKCIMSPSGNVITASGRLCYPHFFQATLPMNETDPKKARFQTSMVFPKDADLSLLKKLVEDTITAKWPEYPKCQQDPKKYLKIRKPFLKTVEHPKIGVDPEAFPVLIRTSSPTRPQIIRGDGSPVTEFESEDVYAGRWARLSLRLYAYPKNDSPNIGKGVSFGLQNVQLLDHDEPLAQMRPLAETEFEAIKTAGAGGDDAKALDSLFDGPPPF